MEHLLRYGTPAPCGRLLTTCTFFYAPCHGISLDQQAGYQSLELLESYPPGPILAGVVLVDADSVAVHLKQLRTHASETIDPDLLRAGITSGGQR